jgi:hypothetical protein
MVTYTPGQTSTGQKVELDRRHPTPGEGGPSTGQATGEGTAAPGVDVADPHPSDEEHPYREQGRGGASTPSDVPIGNDDIGPNPGRHNGKAPPRPHNAGSGPK